MSCDVCNSNLFLTPNEISKNILQQSIQTFIKDEHDIDETILSDIQNILTSSKTLSDLFENITSYALSNNCSPLQKFLYFDLKLPLFLDNRMDVDIELINTILKHSTYGEQKLPFERDIKWGWKYSPKPQRPYKLERKETKEELRELLIHSSSDRSQRITSTRYSGTLEDIINYICESDEEL